MSRLSILCAIVAVVAASPALGEESFEVSACPIVVIDRAILAAERAGIIASDVPVAGTRLKADATVVVLQDEIARTAYATAKLEAESDVEVRAADNARKLARVEYDRAVYANKRHSGTVADLEVQQLLLAARQAELELERAIETRRLNASRESEAKAVLNSYRVLAPFESRVVKVFRSRGEAVSTGDPVIEVASTSRVRIEVDVPIRYRSDLKDGASVTVWPDLTTRSTTATEQESDSKPISGTVVYVGNIAEPITRTLPVHIEADNTAGQLTPGTTATVLFSTSKAPTSDAASTSDASISDARSESTVAPTVRSGLRE